MMEGQAKVVSNADALEVAPGTERVVREGSIPPMATEEEIREALESAFDYRGDVTITLKTGLCIEGYVFDRRPARQLFRSIVRVMPRDSHEKISVPYSEIAALSFTGRDTAAGKSWEAWVRKYWEKKAAGESNIGIQAEPLD